MPVPRRFWGLVLTLLCSRLSLCTGNMCADPSLFRYVLRDQRLDTHPSQIIKTQGFLICVRECLVRRGCLSVNYNTQQQCTLNNYGDKFQMIQEQGTFFTEVKFWPMNLSGRCANHTCQEQTYCVEKTDEIICSPELKNTVKHCRIGLHYSVAENSCKKSCFNNSYGRWFTPYKNKGIMGYNYDKIYNTTLVYCKIRCTLLTTQNCVMFEFQPQSGICQLSIVGWHQVNPIYRRFSDRGWVMYVRGCSP